MASLVRGVSHSLSGCEAGSSLRVQVGSAPDWAALRETLAAPHFV